MPGVTYNLNVTSDTSEWVSGIKKMIAEGENLTKVFKDLEKSSDKGIVATAEGFGKATEELANFQKELDKFKSSHALRNVEEIKKVLFKKSDTLSAAGTSVKDLESLGERLASLKENGTAYSKVLNNIREISARVAKEAGTEKAGNAVFSYSLAVNEAKRLQKLQEDLNHAAETQNMYVSTMVMRLEDAAESKKEIFNIDNTSTDNIEKQQDAVENVTKSVENLNNVKKDMINSEKAESDSSIIDTDTVNNIKEKLFELRRLLTDFSEDATASRVDYYAHIDNDQLLEDLEKLEEKYSEVESEVETLNNLFGGYVTVFDNEQLYDTNTLLLNTKNSLEKVSDIFKEVYTRRDELKNLVEEQDAWNEKLAEEEAIRKSIERHERKVAKNQSKQKQDLDDTQEISTKETVTDNIDELTNKIKKAQIEYEAEKAKAKKAYNDVFKLLAKKGYSPEKWKEPGLAIPNLRYNSEKSGKYKDIIDTDIYKNFESQAKAAFDAEMRLINAKREKNKLEQEESKNINNGSYDDERAQITAKIESYKELSEVLKKVQLGIYEYASAVKNKEISSDKMHNVAQTYAELVKYFEDLNNNLNTFSKSAEVSDKHLSAFDRTAQSFVNRTIKQMMIGTSGGSLKPFKTISKVLLSQFPDITKTTAKNYSGYFAESMIKAFNDLHLGDLIEPLQNQLNELFDDSWKEDAKHFAEARGAAIEIPVKPVMDDSWKEDAKHFAEARGAAIDVQVEPVIDDSWKEEAKHFAEARGAAIEVPVKTEDAIKESVDLNKIVEDANINLYQQLDIRERLNALMAQGLSYEEAVARLREKYTQQATQEAEQREESVAQEINLAEMLEETFQRIADNNQNKDTAQWIADKEKEAADEAEKFKEQQEKARAAAEKLKEALNKVGSAIASAVKDAAKFAGHLAVAGSKGILNTLTFGLFKARKEATLLSKALQLAGVAGIGALFKQASSAANDLTDSVSLVNSTFGKNAADLHKWADETALYYNMSRLEAEKYFGKLGEYMRSTGVGTDASALMAKNLTAKAGEMSRAFAGMTSEEATEQLYKVLSSERPKSAGAKIGLNLSKDALEAELLAEGIDRTYKSLSDAEKVVIKYNAAMRQLKNITGSTSDGFDSWEGAVANLTANAKDALSSLGLIIQHYLLPVVQLLNQVMSAIAQSLRGLLGTLGIELPTAAATAGDALDDTAESAEDAGDKASKSLLPIDKLTVLSDSKGSSGGGKSNAGEELNGLIEPLNWLDDGMKKPMKSLQELLDTIKNADWSKAGKKVAKALNTIIKKAKEFVDKLGQFNLGEKLGDFVNGFIKDFDANALGDLLGTLFGNAQDTITEFLTTFDADEFGQKLADLIIGFDLEENLGKIGTNFGLLVTKMGDTINGMLGGEKGKEVKESIKEGIKNMLSNAIENINAESLGNAIGNLASTIGYALTGAAEGIDGLGTKLADVLNEAIENGGIEDLAKGIADFVVAAAGEVGKFITSTDWLELVKSIISGIKEALDNAPEEDKNALFGVIGAWFGVKTLGTFLKNKLTGKEGTDLGTSVGTALLKGITKALATPAGTLAAAVAALGATIFGLIKSTINLSDYIGAAFDEDIAVDSLNSKIENYAGSLAWSKLAPDEDTLSINAATIDKAEESINLYKDRIKAAFADFELNTDWYGSDNSVTRLKEDAESIRLQLIGIKETGMVIPGLDDTISKLGEIVNYDPDSEVGGTNKLATMFDDAMGNVVEYTRDLDTFQGKIKEFSENTPEYYQKIVDAGANFKIEEETKKIADNLQSWAEADVKEPFEGVKTTAKQIYDYSTATGTVFKDYGEMENVARGLADGSLKIPDKVDAVTESEGKLSDKIDDEVVPSLTHFLESSDKVLNLTWNGDLIDNDALQANLDIAVEKVKTAVKDIEDAINETANLRNFVAVLDSTQTIKVDQSGTMNFKFDVTTKPDKDAFNTWQEKYTYNNKKTVG